MFHRLRPDPGQLDGICALLEAQCIVSVPLALMCVLDSPPGSHDCLTLWVQPAPCCQEWSNVNMRVHVEHLRWGITWPISCVE